jgi:hypothetical protein
MPQPADKIVRWFLIVGFLIPCVLYFFLVVGDVTIDGLWKLILLPWPTSILLMSSEGGGDAGRLVAFVFSAGANAVLYGLLGWLVSWCRRRLLSPAR